MFDLKPINTNELIAIIAAGIAFMAFLVSFLSNRTTRKDSLRVEKSNAYLQLEVASSDVFRYEAEKSGTIEAFRKTQVSDAEKAEAEDDKAGAAVAYNLYFQTLNLFEVCTRFRRQDVIEHEVFASWVAWFYDTLDDWYFRDQWDDLRTNYKRDVRDIFDMGVAIFGKDRMGESDSPEVDDARKAAFYDLVARQMQCSEIAGWLDKVAIATTEAPPWPWATTVAARLYGTTAQ